MSQEQKGGIGSNNLQIGTLITGMTYSDVRQLATDLFKENFATLAASANDIVNERVSQLREEIITRIQEDSRANLDAFGQVEKQILLLDAQRSYAVSGDHELKDILVKAVIEASNSTERSLKSIVLGEAVKVVSLLTKSQIRALALMFIVKHVDFSKGITDLNSLFLRYFECIKDNDLEVTLSEGDFRHLEYVGCGTSSIASANMYTILSSNYGGLLFRGIPMEELVSRFQPEVVPVGWRPSSRTPDRMESVFKSSSKIDSAPWITPHQKAVLKDLLNNNIIGENEVKVELSGLSEKFLSLYNNWDRSNFGHFNLTSTGIAIGYICTADAAKLPDVEIWL